MGCGASKEASPSTAGVVTNGASSKTTSSPSPPQVGSASALSSKSKPAAAAATTTTGRNGGKMSTQQQKTTSSTTNVPNASGASAAASAAAAAAESSSMTDQHKAELLKAGLLMVQLNDVVPGSTEGGAGNNRGRFLSYASGASTPNTSQGNLSWSDENNSGSGGSGFGGPGDSDKDSTDGGPSPQSPSRSGGGGKGGSGQHHHHHRGGGGGGGEKNPKMLKKAHSGSAIDLENLHREKSCTLTSKVVHIEVPFGKPIEEVYDGVHNGPVLGSGVSGLVRLVTHRATGIKYAVKCLDLGLVGTKEGLEQLREEIFVMCQLDHPNIVRLEEVYESHSEIYLVQELCLGGELFDRLDEQPDYHYTEAQCARLVKQMLSAVRYLHSKGIIHRDLKLENFLFSSKAEDSELKMIDFGLSKHFQFGEVHTEAVGTPYTVAPEVIRGKYDERCDIWAIGVITFLLFSGDPPFGGCGGPEPLMTVRQNILNGDFVFEPSDIWDLVSGSGKDFINKLLVTEPSKRPTARDAQKHTWLKTWASRDSQGKHDNVLNPQVVRALVNFKEFSDMRKLLSEVLSYTLLPEQIKDLRKEFEKMDTDGSGEISLQALKQVLLTNAGAGSLGALKEEEVEDIFNAMRVNKAETTIHWHEFIAAGLSQCSVDDRNLRLCFDRLDSDHKGYVTLDDILNLVGNDDLHTEEEMRTMWLESMRSVNCQQRHISYDHFLLLMKGQTREPDPVPSIGLQQPLHPLAEDEAEVSIHGIAENKPSQLISDRSANSAAAKTVTTGNINDGSHFIDQVNDESSLTSLPNMRASKMYDSSGSNIGLTPTGNSSGRPIVSDTATEGSPMVPDMPSTPKTPDKETSAVVPELPAKPGVVRRGRSKSLEDNDLEPSAVRKSPSKASPSQQKSIINAGADARRAINLPERSSQAQGKLANKSALAVNRTLYRAHRQMRLSVIEASRRFEEKQATRARDTLMKEQMKEAIGAGLVMRHGLKLQVTSDAIRKYLDEAKAEQQVLVDKSFRRGGRGRSARKKTISDMSAMLNPSMGQDELGDIAKQAGSQTPETRREINNASFSSGLNMPDLRAEEIGLPPSKPAAFGADEAPEGVRTLRQKQPAPAKVPALPEVDHFDVRKATVPGEFHETQDPFSSVGMYGGSRLKNEDVKNIGPSHTRQGARHSTFN
eukprot:CAMPEP_0113486848 /NCGR_PEP_ID=MMETSP0014_2-20120614/25206_1 /TAXON_ID=2857 /ORGANISM="Nitzschia sp." /LENGTH=1175 /DNA_ID=CAMNT_0000380529 /DNA_START=258 /DNA_END=3785 /DNA_ORIENTATION=- /assembly_acc=CAM_ASM_000159